MDSFSFEGGYSPCASYFYAGGLVCSQNVRLEVLAREGFADLRRAGEEEAEIEQQQSVPSLASGTTSCEVWRSALGHYDKYIFQACDFHHGQAMNRAHRRHSVNQSPDGANVRWTGGTSGTSGR